MFARTDRLLLRPAWGEDAPALARMLADPVLRRAVEDREPVSAHVPLLLLARTGGAPRLVGGVQLANAVAGWRIGFWIARDHWGLGFATEGVDAALALARETLRIGPVDASIEPGNRGAARVLEKTGFRVASPVAAVDGVLRFRNGAASAPPRRAPLAA